jgi:hypothetical protein
MSPNETKEKNSGGMRTNLIASGTFIMRIYGNKDSNLLSRYRQILFTK